MATWNERIDNLQARLANLVSEEFAGANFYNTNIAVSDYNPSIDSTVTVTITVTNAEGDPVEDASVPVTASEGQFTKLNNTTITAASSVTGTTNSSGQFTLTYSCTEWGLITFSAKNHNVQISVTGWKQVQSLSSNHVIVYTDGKNAKIVISGTFITSTSAGEYNLGTIDSAYNPDANYSTNYSYGVTNYAPVFIRGNDNVIHLYKNASSSSNVACYCTLFYPLKTPLY